MTDPVRTDTDPVRDRALVEKAIGRPLRDAEKVVDVLLLNSELEAAKDLLEAAIRKEMLRATVTWIRLGLPPMLHVTDGMRRPLRTLHRLGREEARNELDRAGYKLRARTYAHPADPEGHSLAAAEEAINLALPGVTVRITDELVVADFTNASAAAIAEALLRIPGARDIASRVISTALTSGLAATFEEHADLVKGWLYSAVLDGGTCDVCGPLDGTEYATLEELFVDLPGFGPNSECDGGGRCRCRGVPLGA